MQMKKHMNNVKHSKEFSERRENFQTEGSMNGYQIMLSVRTGLAGQVIQDVGNGKNKGIDVGKYILELFFLSLV